MTIAEGSSARFAYKFYSTGTMTSNAEADTSTEPGASGGQVLRRVSAALNLRTNSTRSNEMLPSKQIRSFRQTSRHVEGTITGELSPGSYTDFFEAVHRDTRVALTGPTGASSIIPATGHVRRKLLIERYNSDLDKARIYTECRATSYRITVPAQGISTVEIGVMGRNRHSLAATASPYFSSPTDPTSTEVCTSLSGQLTIGGTPVGLVTAFDVSCTLASEAPNVLGQPFPPDILLGTGNVSGNMTFLLDDTDLASAALEAETELALVLTLTNSGYTGSLPTSGFVKIELPRIKLGTADEDVRGELSQPITASFQALENTVGDGVTNPLSTIRITDIPNA